MGFGSKKTLLELCEPLFRGVCRINRSARKGVDVPQPAVRGELSELLDTLVRKASENGIAHRLERVQPALLAFCDEMVMESELSWAHKWSPLAEEEGIDDGPDVFFRVLEEVRAKSDDDAIDCMGVLYVCLGLGFVGSQRGNTAELREIMSELSSSLRHMMDSDRGSRIVPEAYENIDTSDLVQPPARGLVGIGIAMVVLAVCVIIGNLYFFRSASSALSTELTQIRDNALTGEGGER
ncbi:MAG: DotU family type IV/VI secretion system protein [Planctomycetota bacterium]